MVSILNDVTRVVSLALPLTLMQPKMLVVSAEL